MKKKILILCNILFVVFATTAQYVGITYEDLPTEVQQKIDENKILGLSYFADIEVTFQVELRNIQQEYIELFKDKLSEDVRVISFKLSEDAQSLFLKAKADYTIKDIDACTRIAQGWVENFSQTFAVE